MEIRHASLADLQALTEVEAECFPAAEAATETSFRARLRAYPNHFWLMYDQGKLVSFVNGMVTDERDLTDEMYQKAELHRENGDWQMIFGVDTIPAYRRQGLAEKLLHCAIDEAKAQGRMGVVLTCKDELIPYYSKFGFVNEGVSQSVHGNVVWNQMRLTF